MGHEVLSFDCLLDGSCLVRLQTRLHIWQALQVAFSCRLPSRMNRDDWLGSGNQRWLKNPRTRDGGFSGKIWKNHLQMVDEIRLSMSRGKLEQPWFWFSKKKIVTTPDSIQRLHSTHHPFSIESVIHPRD